MFEEKSSEKLVTNVLDVDFERYDFEKYGFKETR